MSWRERHGLDVAVAGSLVALGSALSFLLPGLLGIDVHTGPDAPLWILNARNLLSGSPSFVAPGFPRLIAIFTPFTGDPILAAAGLVTLCTSLPGGLLYGLARTFGASRTWAAAAALGLLFYPHLAIFGLQIQPDAPTTALFLLYAFVAVHAWRSPSLAGDVGTPLALTAILLFREQGFVTAIVGSAFALAAPGTSRQRLLRGALLTLAFLLLPGMVGGMWGWPWEAPWLERLRMPTRDLLSNQPPSYVQDFPYKVRATLVDAHRRGDLLVVLLLNTTQSLRQVGEGWAVVALALLAMVRGRPEERAACAPAMITVLPGFFLHSQPRHVAVVLPVAMALLVSRGRSWGVAGLLLCLGGLSRWPGVAILEQNLSRMYAENDRVAQRVAALATPGSMAAGDVRLLFTHPLPFASLPNVPGNRWNTFWILPRNESPSEGWTSVAEMDDVHVFQFHPELKGVLRPCFDSVLVSRRAWFWSTGKPAPTPKWEPACDVP